MIIVSNPLHSPGKASRTVSVSDLLLNPVKLLRSVARGSELTITHRRKAVARVLPLGPETSRPGVTDPFFRLADRAESMGVLDNAQIDEVIDDV
jgi:antitoxin (DNA-binding transcriptional repressor) of toxin-antitoxin stability system